ncbi:crossover junction endodeoxyribonuclease RuvC [Bacillus thuringiensis]
MSEYLLGLDISGTSTGYAVIAREETGELRLCTVGHIKTSSKNTDGERMSKIRDRIDILFDIYPISKVIRERGFSNNRHRSTQLIFKSIGVAELTCNDRGFPEVIEYAPTTIKLQVGGSGKADKDDVKKGVKKFFPDAEFKTDDESDAVAVILTYLLKEGLLCLSI